MRAPQAARDYLAKRGVSEEIAKAASLRADDERITFPWIDEHGQEVCTTSRSINDSEPKYRHSPGPRPALYAGPGAWESVRVALVEGHFDVLACAAAGMAGFATAGATSFSPEAANILATKDEVILVADADEPGKGWRGRIVEALGGRVTLLEAPLPEGAKDIADVAEQARENPGEAVAGVLADAEPVEKRKSSRAIDGASFILDTPAEVPRIWGSPQQVLWAQGESFLVVGPSGVGKTTLAQQLALARIGLGSSLLDMPVAAASKPVLYIAADRPSQAARSFARMVTELDRAVLAERLTVWRGPLPFDIAGEPERFAEFVQDFGAGTVVIDSLKDVALDLTKDETGSRLNHALQLATSEGVEVCALHHQRKATAGNAKPRALADVYGSTWITAGAGSVLLLWGDAGDILLAGEHLKQPAGEVGPLKIRHDHVAGRSVVHEPTDLLGLVKAARSGLTAVDAARALFEVGDPTPNQRERARRRLDDLVRRDLALKRDGASGGTRGGTAATYCLKTLLGAP